MKMRGWLQTTACALTLVLAGSSLARADDASDVKAALKTFGQAMVKGDAAGAKAVAISGEDNDKVIDAMAEAVSAQNKLRDAAIAKFGDAGKALSQMNMGDKIQEKLDAAKVEVTGDTAVVTDGSPEPLHLKKIDGKWKIDMAQQIAAQGKEKIGQLVHILSMATKVANEASTEIKDGKYKDVEEAQQAIAQKYRDMLTGAQSKDQ